MYRDPASTHLMRSDLVNEYLEEAARRYPHHISVIDGGEPTPLSVDVHRDAAQTEAGAMSVLVCVLKEVKRISNERGERVGVGRIRLRGEGPYLRVVADIGSC